jgi:hypothetical protein
MEPDIALQVSPEQLIIDCHKFLKGKAPFIDCPRKVRHCLGAFMLFYPSFKKASKFFKLDENCL